jgi:peptidoglycan/xylan/chitin deacetylase (PgdA/CDA1 family)
MDLYDLAAPARLLRRRLRTARPSSWPRVDRICRVPGRRLVAITFDDGPTALRTAAGEPLTESILRALERHGMRATFNMIGGTHDNYPDRAGPLHSPLWNGIRYDHYPAFGLDAWAGAANQPLLARRVVQAGHEVGNHSFRHLAFGPERIVYGRRTHHGGAADVERDCIRFQEFCHTHLGARPVVARPPHYVARTADGIDTLAIYRRLGLTMVGASFDLGAWRARQGSRRAYAAAAVAPLAEALARDPDALDGSILFAKDGLNMSLEPVVAEVLPEQLRILHRYGYRVVPAGELIARGRCADLRPEDPLAEAVVAMLALGVPCAYTDNTVRPDRRLGERDAALIAAAVRARRPGLVIPGHAGRERRAWLLALHAAVGAAAAEPCVRGRA